MNNEQKHSVVWEAVSLELSTNPRKFTKEQIEQARRYAQADAIDRARGFNGVLLDNPICSAINYSEMDPIDRYRATRSAGSQDLGIGAPKDRLYEAVDQAAQKHRIF
jgi:hypothetical protein